MAIAEEILKKKFGSSLINHKTYVIASDGDLMEGISHEAMSLAGHLKLKNLVVFFDNNKISIDGSTKLAVSDNYKKRFESYGWSFQEVNGHNEKQISRAIKKTLKSNKPSLISCKTIIGYGSPNKAGKESSHGAALGKEEVLLVRKKLKWKYGAFEIPKKILNEWREIGKRGNLQEKKWNSIYIKKGKKIKDEFTRLINGKLPKNLDKIIEKEKRKLFDLKPVIASRKASELLLETIANNLPELIGGSADLSGSNNTKTKHSIIIKPSNFKGNYIHYGVREHAMGAIMSGISLHGGLVPYGGTFLVFADYMRPAIRLASMMGLQVIYVFTHDSIGVGEDGPTHQPIEHLLSLRSIPGLTVIRPADATETSEAWRSALTRKNGPTALVLTRQKLPVLHRTAVLNEASGAAQGGYVLRESNDQPQAILLSTGSEIHVALEASTILEQHGVETRVVSMPSFENFDEQSKDYREHVLPSSVKVRVAIEAGVSAGWDRFVGEKGRIIGIDRFGASAPAETVYKHLGLTADKVVDTVLDLM